MKKIKEWDVVGQGDVLNFHVEFYQDTQSGDFVAKIEMIPEVPQYVGSESPLDVRDEELRDKDLNKLYEKTDQFIKERRGRLVTKKEKIIQ